MNGINELRNGNRKQVVTYTNTMSNELLKKHIIKIIVYGLELLLWIIVSRLYSNFGIKWIVPSVSAMWVMGAITAFFVKEEQENTVKTTKNAVAGYLLFLLLYRFIIQRVSGISSEEIALSLGINVTQAAGMAISSWLQNILLLTSVMTPAGYLIWCAQKFKTFSGRERKSDAFDRIKDIRKEDRKY